MSRNEHERRAKIVTALTYTGLHALALLGAVLLWSLQAPFTIPKDFNPTLQWAMLAPVAGVVIFTILHVVDWRRSSAPRSDGGKDNRIWGLQARADAAGAKPGDYASSSISRLSIHSALAVGVIAAVKGLGTPGVFTAGMLGLAVMLGMVAVLCYAQSSRWIDEEGAANDVQRRQLWTKRELLKKATVFDQLAWYALTTGLIWALATIAGPIPAIVASFVYGLFLWLYYFRWDSSEIQKANEQPKQATEIEPTSAA